ncbi:MAG: site-specific DNA-methyltransferase, partial [Erysipelotrichia bacterium]|nr:site-specific DNA-methyltransferase [Erysipelotrichia bacterium]
VIYDVLDEDGKTVVSGPIKLAQAPFETEYRRFMEVGNYTVTATLFFKNGDEITAETKQLVINRPETALSIVTDPSGNHFANDLIAFEHPAIFPEKLVADHITSWTNEGDLVYDCFMGSGTTAKVATVMNRYFLGSEMETEFVELSNKRLKPYLHTLFNCPTGQKREGKK